MELIYHFQRFKQGYNPPAVYKLIFDTGHFYIGSSSKVKSRFRLWRTTLKRGAFHNKDMKAILPFVKIVKMEVIEFVPKEFTRQRETDYINMNLSSPFLLNKHKTAIGDGSRKKLSSQERHKRKYVPKQRVLKPKKPKVSNYVPKGKWVAPPGHIFSQSKAVVKFGVDCSIIARYDSISQAASSAGIGKRTMEKHLKRLKLKGGKPYYRTECDKRPYSVGKKEPIPKIPIKYPEMSGGKFVLDTLTGVFYYSVRDLCDLYGYKEKSIYKKLSGDARNNTQFVYV